MGTYFARRFLLIIPTFLGITFLVFTITRFVPGGPIEQMVAKMQMAASEAGSSGSATSTTEIASIWPPARSATSRVQATS